MRMALDLGLHRALEKLADPCAKRRSEEEERDLGKFADTSLALEPEHKHIHEFLRIPAHTCIYQLSADSWSRPSSTTVVSARIWLCLYWFDHQYVHSPFLLSLPSSLPTNISRNCGSPSVATELYEIHKLFEP